MHLPTIKPPTPCTNNSNVNNNLVPQTGTYNVYYRFYNEDNSYVEVGYFDNTECNSTVEMNTTVNSTHVDVNHAHLPLYTRRHNDSLWEGEVLCPTCGQDMRCETCSCPSWETNPVFNDIEDEPMEIEPEEVPEEPEEVPPPIPFVFTMPIYHVLPQAIEMEDIDDNDFGPLWLGPTLVQMPALLTTGQMSYFSNFFNWELSYNRAFECNVATFVFHDARLEDLYMNIPICDRPFYSHCDISFWVGVMEHYVQTGEFLQPPEFDYELAQLKEKLHIFEYSFMFHLVFYATDFVDFMHTGRICRGLKGGARTNHRGGNRSHMRKGKIEEARNNDAERKNGNKDGRKETKQERALPQCRICKEFGHKSFECPVAPTCTNCNRRGHQEHSCRGRKDVPNPGTPLAEAFPVAEAPPPAAPKVEPPQVNDCTTLAVREDVPKFEVVKPTDLGITFRTGTHYYLQSKRSYTPNDFANWLHSKGWFPSPMKIINDRANNFPGTDMFTSVCMKVAFVLLRPLFFEVVKTQTVHRVGGLTHEVGKICLPHESKDVRHDYVAIGDVKHSNPLYSPYGIAAFNVSVLQTAISAVKSLAFNFEIIDEVGLPKVTRNEALAAPMSVVSKELFYNLANSRIAPYLSDDSAKNSISISISKTPLINLSKEYIAQNRLASGCSDEAIARTREALMDYRTHLKEEQVLRHLQKMVSLYPDSYIPGPLEDQPNFKVDSSQALN